MITFEQITAETLTPALTDVQVLALLMLVKSYNTYAIGIGRWPNIEGQLALEQATPTVKTQALKAVLTALSKLPRLVVESNGTDKSHSFFSTKINWDELAQDVLNILYKIPIVAGESSFLVTRADLRDTLEDNQDSRALFSDGRYPVGVRRIDGLGFPF